MSFTIKAFIMLTSNSNCRCGRHKVSYGHFDYLFVLPKEKDGTTRTTNKNPYQGTPAKMFNVENSLLTNTNLEPSGHVYEMSSRATLQDGVKNISIPQSKND